MNEFFALASVLFSEIFFYIFTFLFALLFLIALHEYGHFLAARHYGVRVDKFSVGFGREIFGRTDRRGTRWSLSAIPLGGYVQIFGDYDVQNPRRWDEAIKATRPLTPEELSVAFCTRTVWQRMVIVMAGPLINLIPAIVLMAFIFSFYGQISCPPQINGIDINSASYEAGFRLGDRILEFDGKPIRRFEDIWDITFKEYTKTFRFKVLRDNSQTLYLEMKPREEKYIDTKGIERSNGRGGMTYFRGLVLKDIVSVDGISTDKNQDEARRLLLRRLDKVIKIGIRYRQDEISIYEIKLPSIYNKHLTDPTSKYYDNIFPVDKNNPYFVRLGLWESLSRTSQKIAELPLEIYKRLTATLSGKNDDQVVGGLGKMSTTVADSAKEGIYAYILFLCIFSIQLAFINLLPIPVLDGGYIIFLTYEALRGKPLPQKVQTYAFIIGVVLLAGIMVFANISDIFYFLR